MHPVIKIENIKREEKIMGLTLEFKLKLLGRHPSESVHSIVGI